ncbi:hypothetical protein BUALT_Bualt07G0043000 [Buddleja alternifolia]|uniref:Uncharacterized protein n=1 Tax=Buddleja alternifolia TaxID=168488 RepID=A0AAV6XEN3_9LAMI|nr:hypothetical protein BUALT_Bualt07G0043000 [Buddleja alternifolia]
MKGECRMIMKRIEVYIVLASEGKDVRALHELTLLDQSGKGKHSVHTYFDGLPGRGLYTLKQLGSMWSKFFDLVLFFVFDYLKDDCLKIDCTFGVVLSVNELPGLHLIKVPESDIGSN